MKKQSITSRLKEKTQNTHNRTKRPSLIKRNSTSLLSYKIQEALTIPKETSKVSISQQVGSSSLSNTLNNSSSFKLNGSLNRSKASLKDFQVKKQHSLNSFSEDMDAIFNSLPLPLKPHQALKRFHAAISSYEQGEILEYQEIYFLGFKAKKNKTEPSKVNFGFDDERSDYKLVAGDHIAYRYEVQKMLGKGSFGQVVRCYDHKNKECIAMKIIRNQKRFQRQGKVEIKVLRHILKHDPDESSNCVHIQKCFMFRNHICLVFDLLSVNLYELLKSSKFKGFSLSLVRRFAVQLLETLSFLERNHIIHCDLKPENVLLRSPNKSRITVIDFGSSCFETDRVYTYIQSRFYRAPEIMLGIPYTCSIDIWSLGCCVAELHSGRPLFAGENEKEQLACIIEIKGSPPASLLKAATRKKLFFDEEDNYLEVVNTKGRRRIPNSRSLEEKLGSSDPKLLDFLRRCLEWDPSTRIKPQEALMHPWITEC